MFWFSFTRLHSVFSITLPVASPPACKILFILCAPSSVYVILPLSSLSKLTPKSINSFITSLEFSEINFVISYSDKPAPALKVSLI